jgi:hypothetical protein
MPLAITVRIEIIGHCLKFFADLHINSTDHPAGSLPGRDITNLSRKKP